jgi:hypothetical protein
MVKGIQVPHMDEQMPNRCHLRLDGMIYTNLHFYKFEILYVAVGKICIEMNHHFCEASIEVLKSFSCFSPKTLSHLMWTSLLDYLQFIMWISLTGDL